MKNNQKNKKQVHVKKNNYKIYLLYILVPLAIILLSRSFDSNTQSNVNRNSEHKHVHENDQELKLNYPTIK
jgi:hypothetical protein